MSAPIVSKQQKELKTWLKLRETCRCRRHQAHQARQEVQHVNPRMKPSRFKGYFPLPRQMTTAGSSLEGEARGECNPIFPGRYQKAKNDQPVTPLTSLESL
jgi:hypothetical protein